MTHAPYPKMQHPAFVMRAFYDYQNADQLLHGVGEILRAQRQPRGYYVGDNLISLGKSLSFLDDKPLRTAWQTHSETAAEKAALWRRAILVWAARTALRHEGDFVECGCYKGTGVRIVADVLEFAKLDRKYYLYDLFDHDPSMPHHSMVEHGAELVDRVRARFADTPNVIITQGRVPDSLAVAAPEKIALMHLDLNNAAAEIGALEVLFDRIVPGGILLLDDYGWLFYQDQLKAEQAWFAERGYFVLELPTGQGMVIK